MKPYIIALGLLLSGCTEDDDGGGPTRQGQGLVGTPERNVQRADIFGLWAVSVGEQRFRIELQPSLQFTWSISGQGGGAIRGTFERDAATSPARLKLVSGSMPEPLLCIYELRSSVLALECGPSYPAAFSERKVLLHPASPDDPLPASGVASVYETVGVSYRSYYLNNQAVIETLRQSESEFHFEDSPDYDDHSFDLVGRRLDLIPLAQQDRVIDFTIAAPLYMAPVPQALYPEFRGQLFSHSYRADGSDCDVSFREGYEREQLNGYLSASLTFTLHVELRQYYLHADVGTALKRCVDRAVDEVAQKLGDQKIALHATLAN